MILNGKEDSCRGMLGPASTASCLSVHLYTGLFRALDGRLRHQRLFFNHDQWFARWFSFERQSWQDVRKMDLPAGSIPSGDPAEQARAVLQKLDLDGPHRIMGDPNANELRIYRMCAAGNFLISWRRDQSQVVVQRRQPYSLWMSIHSLHFGHGYDWRYPSLSMWAIAVDLVVTSMWFWSVSGIYLWARRPKGRFWGGVCLVGGGLLFAVLVALLWR